MPTRNDAPQVVRPDAEATWGTPPNVWRKTRKAGWRPHLEEYPAPRVRVAEDHCVGCLACADACQPRALRLMPNAWAISADSNRCNGCRRCVQACPFGLITVSGFPRTRHQVVLDNLGSTLASNCPAGLRVYTVGPSPASWLAGSILIPDLAVVRDDPPADPRSPQHPTTVALVAEVVSSRTRDDDLGYKRELYRAQGVPAYWTVDQCDGQVTVHWSTPPAWHDRWAGCTFG